MFFFIVISRICERVSILCLIPILLPSCASDREPKITCKSSSVPAADKTAPDDQNAALECCLVKYGFSAAGSAAIKNLLLHVRAAETVVNAIELVEDSHAH